MSTTAEGLPAAFIDRDGVINEERAYVHRIEDFAFVPGAIPGLRALQAQGFALIVVTNQAGIARGYYDEQDLARLHAHMTAELAAAGVSLTGIEYCAHHPDGIVPSLRIECDCRKPRPGMLLAAAHEFGIDLTRSVMIGDKRGDVQAGKAAGVRASILVRSGHAIEPGDDAFADAVCTDLDAAAAWIAAQHLGPMT